MNKNQFLSQAITIFRKNFGVQSFSDINIPLLMKMGNKFGDEFVLSIAQNITKQGLTDPVPYLYACCKGEYPKYNQKTVIRKVKKLADKKTL